MAPALELEICSQQTSPPPKAASDALSIRQAAAAGGKWLECSRDRSSTTWCGRNAPHPIVDRTINQLRKAKPSAVNGLASIDGLNVIKISVAPASIDRLELTLRRLISTTMALGIVLEKHEKGVAFISDGEAISFSISEIVRREKHVLTAKELAEDEAAENRRARRWNKPLSWDDDDLGVWSRRPEWDYHPTGQLILELEHKYFLGSSPRRSFKDAKIQRLDRARQCDPEGPAGKSLTTPAQRRDAALGVVRDYQISQRRACGLIGVDPKSACDGNAGGMAQSRARRERPPDHAEIREEMRDIASRRRRFGYRRVGVTRGKALSGKTFKRQRIDNVGHMRGKAVGHCPNST